MIQYFYLLEYLLHLKYFQNFYPSADLSFCFALSKNTNLSLEFFDLKSNLAAFIDSLNSFFGFDYLKFLYYENIFLLH